MMANPYRTLFRRLPIVASWCALAIFTVGCEPPQGSSGTQAGHGEDHAHDHGDDHRGEHQHPETYEEALAEIKELHESVREVFTSGGDPHDADADVHEVGHLLEDLPDLAEMLDLSVEAMSEVKQAADRAFEAYADLDTLIHDGPDAVDVTFEEVNEIVDAALADLEAVIK